MASDIVVIIVTYRSAHLTVEALRTVAAERDSSGLSIRAIIVDNASGDLPVISQAVRTNEWSWVTLVQSDTNGGFAAGNNLGIKRAYQDGKPDYVYLLNPDTQVRPGGILHLARFLDARPEVGIAGGCFEKEDGSDWAFAFRFPSVFSEVDIGMQFGLLTHLLDRWVVARVMSPEAQPVDWICGASMMIRPAVLKATGGLDENFFLYFEETDFCRRAGAAGWPTWYVPDSRVMHIMGQSTYVTDLRQGPKRLPGYWFESRRRYYVLAFGVPGAMVIDLFAILASGVGNIKRFLMGRHTTGVPHFLRDLMRHSVIWPGNRRIPQFRSCLQDR